MSSSSIQPGSSKRGQKRKRGDLDADVPELKKLATKLYHAIKDIKKAVRKAKMFEMQKVVKKLKQNDAATSEAIQHLEAELEALKVLDVDRVALVSLSAKIHKEKQLLANTDAMDVVQAQLGGYMTNKVDQTAAGKIESRLLSSRHLAMENAKAVQSLVAILGSSTDSGYMVRSTTVPSLGINMRSQSKGIPQRMTKPPISAQDQDAGDTRGSMDASDEHAYDGWEPGSLDEEDSASSPEDNSVGEIARNTRLSTIKNPTMTPTDSSTFLPSLAVGFTRGDSDESDWDDDGEPTTPARKNRRGQRARKAIWEKKYGAGANHVKNQREEALKNQERSSTTRTFSRTGHPKLGARSLSLSGRQNNSASRPTAPNQSERVADMPEQPIHPSWLAKRKLKEKESASIVPALGKKIVFE